MATIISWQHLRNEKIVLDRTETIETQTNGFIPLTYYFIVVLLPNFLCQDFCIGNKLIHDDDDSFAVANQPLYGPRK